MKILLPIDGSAHTKRMLAYLAAHDEMFGRDKEYVILTAVTPLSSYVAQHVPRAIVDDHYRELAEEVLAPVRTFAGQAGWKAELTHRLGEPAACIAEAAEQLRPDLVVMGSHGHGAFGNLVLGSVATKVLATSKVPVLIVR